MAQVRSNIPPAYCLEEVQCGDTLTAVDFNKLVSSVQNLQKIGTHGCDIPERLINNVRRPAHGWSQGTVVILDSANPGTYNVDMTHELAFWPDMNKFTLCFDARLLQDTHIVGASAQRLSIDVEIVAIGYNGATQLLTEVVRTGQPVSPQGFSQAPGSLASPGGAIKREIDGAWNSNMLPPSGIHWQGTLRLRLRVTKALVSPLSYFNRTQIQIPGLLDFFGIRALQLRHYKNCQ